MKKIALYKKFHQVMDYALPVLVLFIVFRPTLPLVARVVLAIMVLMYTLAAVQVFRVTMDSKNIYLNNLFINKTIPLASVKSIEPAPFYFGATSGRFSEKGYRIIYEKNQEIKKDVVLVGKKKEVLQAWEEVERQVRLVGR